MLQLLVSHNSLCVVQKACPFFEQRIPSHLVLPDANSMPHLFYFVPPSKKLGGHSRLMHDICSLSCLYEELVFKHLVYGIFYLALDGLAINFAQIHLIVFDLID